jgi:hypothetical protein
VFFLWKLIWFYKTLLNYVRNKISSGIRTSPLYLYEWITVWEIHLSNHQNQSAFTFLSSSQAHRTSALVVEYLYTRFAGALSGLANPRAPSLCVSPTKSSQEVFVSFSSEERAPYHPRRPTSQPRCLNLAPLCI